MKLQESLAIMNENQDLGNRLLYISLLVLLLPVGTVYSQTDLSDDIHYDWSTFLLLVIPVLIILVVLVLCVTGVFMFCLSTLTMNYDQDCHGHIMGSHPTPEVKKTLFGLQMCSEKDWLDKGLPVSDAVKCAADEPEESRRLSEDGEIKERTSTNLMPDLESQIHDGHLIAEKHEVGKLKEVAIEIETCSEQEESPSPPTNSNVSAFTPTAHLSSPSDCSISLPLTVHPALVHSNLPTLQHLNLQYFRPQDEGLCAVGVRG